MVLTIITKHGIDAETFDRMWAVFTADSDAPYFALSTADQALYTRMYGDLDLFAQLTQPVPAPVATPAKSSRRSRRAA